MFVKFSPEHSSNVRLILKTRTGYISPQFHTLQNDLFSTAPNANSGGLTNNNKLTEDDWIFPQSNCEWHIHNTDLDHDGKPIKLPKLND